MFDPSLGRWITEDPISFAGGEVNLYRGMGNNPANRVDPNGTDWRDWAYVIVPLPALAAELLNGQEPSPQAATLGRIITWIAPGPIGVQSAKLFWYWVATQQMDAKGFTLSGAMLKNSLGAATSPYKIGPGHFAYNTIVGNSDLQAKANSIAKSAPLGASSGSTTMEFTEAGSQDLAYALANVNLKYTLSKNADDDWKMEVMLYDRYNFERNIKNLWEKNTMVWAGANAAWLSQFTGVIQPFDVEVGPFQFSRGFIKRAAAQFVDAALRACEEMNKK